MQPLVAVEQPAAGPAAGLEAELLHLVHLDRLPRPAEVDGDALTDEQERVVPLGEEDTEGPGVPRRRRTRRTLRLTGRGRRWWRRLDPDVEQHPAEQRAGAP